MRLPWRISRRDVGRVRAIVEEHADSGVVQDRLRYLESAPRVPGRARIWRHLVTCLLTSQQRSGPDSAVARFVRSRPYPLTHARCRGAADLAAYAEDVLEAARGLRFPSRIAGQLATNMDALERGDWRRVGSALEPLVQDRSRVTPRMEREAALALQRLLKGLGPKQSRNLLQLLELSQHEIPIDSRIIRWLDGLGFPVRLSATALGDVAYYEFVSDGLQALCAEAGVVPCVLDAAVFRSFDAG